MQATIKERAIKKSLVLVLSAVLLLTVLLPTNAFANSNLWRGGTALTYETTSAAFSTGSDNKLTVVAIAKVLSGSPQYVTVKLQKYSWGGYVTVKTMSVPTNGISKPILQDEPVSTNTTYRLVYSCDSSSGANSADISMGIVIWS